MWTIVETGVGMFQVKDINISRAKIWPPHTPSVACKHCGPHFSEKLILQASSRVLTEGEPLALRCHGWRNKLMFNVIFYRNGKSFRYSRRSEITILKTNSGHSGVYHCSGKGRRHRYRSAEVPVTVKGIPSR